MIRAFDQRELMELRRLRMLRYDTYCIYTKEEKRVSIYEYQKIEGDPTPEELAEMEQEQQDERQREIEEVYKYYQQVGAI